MPRVPLATLIEDPANVRQHPEPNLEAIKASLTRFGQQKPIVVGSDSVVIAGNGTLLAARALGWDKLNVIHSQLSGAEAKAYAVADNQTALLAEWDEAGLASLLGSLDDLEGTGFDQGDLDELLASLNPKQGLTDPDDVPEPPEEAVTKLGDLWLLGDHRLLCGDARVVLPTLMAGAIADMVWTDPPYGVDVTGGTHDPRDKANYGKGRKLTGDALTEEATEQLWREVAGATAQSCRAGAVWYSAAPPGPLHLRFARVLDDLGILRQMIVWVKSNFVFGRSDYHYRHEPIMYGWVPGAAHLEPPSRDQDTVWEFERPGRDLSHPTMKPVGLVARAIANSSKPGNLILDPFAGSGTTAIAAEQEGRKAYLMEIDPLYCDVIVSRWERFTGNTAVKQA